MVLTENRLQPINENSINLSIWFVNPILKLHKFDI
jgi:hypothetical protein